MCAARVCLVRGSGAAGAPVAAALDESPDVHACCGRGHDDGPLFLLLSRHELNDGLGLSETKELLQGGHLFLTGHDAPVIQHLSGRILNANQNLEVQLLYCSFHFSLSMEPCGQGPR